MRRYSSTRSFARRTSISWALPLTSTSPPGSWRSFVTVSTSSSGLTTTELFHAASSIEPETTYLRMPLNLSANSPVRDGHASAKPS